MKPNLKLTTAIVAVAVASTAPAAFAEDGIVLSGNSAVKLTLSGQVNRGLLFVDDGQSSDTFFVDNDNSSTRLRFEAEADVGSVTYGSNIEVEIESNSTSNVNQLDEDTGSESFNQRKLEVFAEGAFGKVSLGQGSTASDGASEADLSGTGVVAYSGISDFAGGILLREDGGALSASTIGDAFSNFDGQGRRDRLRYDTPEFAGFSLSASVAEDDRSDVALHYGGEFGAFKLAAAVAYSEADEDERVNGSFSVLHDSGVSFTYASGEDDIDGQSFDPSFNYYKLGYETAFVDLGNTAFSVDYYDGSDGLAQGVDAESYGIAVVQNIDAINAEVYLGYRTYEADGFQDVEAVLAGARFRF